MIRAFHFLMFEGGSFLSFVFDRTIVVKRTHCPRKVCEIES